MHKDSHYATLYRRRPRSPALLGRRVAGVQPLHGRAEQRLELAGEFHQVQELLAFGVEGLQVFGAREQETRRDLPVKLGLGDGDNFHVGKIAAEYAGGHFQFLEHVGKQ